MNFRRTARRFIASLLLLLAFGLIGQKAIAAPEPRVGPLKVTYGGFLGIKMTYLRVDVKDADRVVFGVNGRKIEGYAGKTDSCGVQPCRTWWRSFSGFRKVPLERGFSFMIDASNEFGRTKVIGERCRKGPFCAPYRVRCSPFDKARWNRLSSPEVQPVGSPLWYYARTLQKCGTLIGMDREEVYAALGEPDSETEFWAYWDLWQQMGDIRSFSVDLRRDQVVGVDGTW